MKHHTAHHHATFSIFYLLFIICLLVIGGYFFYLWQTGKFGKFDRFNMVLQGSPVRLASLNISTKTAVVVNLPDDLYIPEVLPSYGGYPISSVYNVGMLDKKGAVVLSDTVSGYMGVPVDGFAKYAGKLTDPRFLFVMNSNLNFLDRVRLIIAWLGVRFDKVAVVDVGSMAVPLILADGSLAQSVDKEVLDNVLSQKFLEEKIRDEGLRIEVINSTAVIGLGAKVARVLTNIGASVVNVGSGTEVLNQCEVRSEKIDYVTVRRMAEVFSCKIIAGNNSSRADVSLVLAK